jgi:hypothetical protein
MITAKTREAKADMGFINEAPRCCLCEYIKQFPEDNPGHLMCIFPDGLLFETKPDSVCAKFLRGYKNGETQRQTVTA